MKVLMNHIFKINWKSFCKITSPSSRFCTDPKWPFMDIPIIKYSRLSEIWNGGQKMLHKQIDNLHAKHGPAIYKDTVEGFKVLFVSDPELNLQVFRCEGKFPIHVIPESWKLCLDELNLKRGLFFMDGIEWKTNRRVMTRIMGQQESIEKVTPLLNMTAMHLINDWKEKLPSGKTLERDMHKWSIETVALSCIGANLDSDIEHGDNKTISKEFLDAAYTIFEHSMHFYRFSPLIAQKFNLPRWKKFKASIGTALKLGKEIVQNGIEKHSEQVPIHPCIMDEMIDKTELSDDTIYRIVIDMIITAGDTSSLTALWTFYVLGRNKEVALKCRKEIREVLEDRKVITLDDIAQMPYLAAVCKEAMRMYPVVPFITRLTASDVIHDKYYVPANTMVATSLFTMLRDENIFPNPDELLPERWTRDGPDEKKELRSTMSKSFIPFGIGSRSCIGKYLSRAQVHILVTHLLMNFDWEVLDDVEPVLRMITVPSKNLNLKIRNTNSDD